MAARFWVPVAGVSTGNWNDTNHWATTSGGAGGAATPTASDDVTFDSNSGTNGTVTVNVAANALTITLNKSDLTLTQSASLTVAGAYTLTTGSWTTGSNAVSLGSFSSSNSNTRSLTGGTSTFTITGVGIVWDCTTTTGLTVSMASATISIPGTSDYTFRGGSGKLYGTLTVAQCNSLSFGATGTLTNCSVTGRGVLNVPVTLFVSFTVTTALTLAGGTTRGNNRMFFAGDTPGTTRTITCTGATVTINGDVDFEDVAIAGAPTWSNPGNAFVGDAGGNSGITATVAAPQAWQTTVSGSWSTAGSWTSRVPLPQDDVTIAKAFSAGQTITANMPRLGRSVDFTGTTGNPLLTRTVGNTIYGSLTMAAGMTHSGSQAITFSGRSGSFSINAASVAFSSAGGWTLTINAPGSTYTLGGDLTVASASLGTLTVQNGTLDASTKNVTVGFVFGGASTSAIRFGTGLWTIGGTGTVFSRASSAITAGSAIIDLTDASSTAKTFAGGGQTYPTLRWKSTGAGNLTITGSGGTFAAVDFETSTARTLTIPTATTFVTGSITVTGSTGQLLSVASATPGTAAKIQGTTCGATITTAFLSLSADVTITAKVCSPTTVPFPTEGLAGLRRPRTINPPSEEAPPALLSIAQGTVVAVVIPSFASSVTQPANNAIFSLDDGTSTNRLQLVWGIAHSWQARRIDAGHADTTPAVAETFAALDRLLVAVAWDPTTNYVSAAGAAFQSAAATASPTGIKHLMLARGSLGAATGDLFNGTVAWIAGFSAKLSDADVAALYASYLNADPQFAQLPGSPTFLWTNATKILVTTDGTGTQIETLEALAGITATALDPAESLTAATGTAADPLEALYALTAAAVEPAEALAVPVASALEPLEALTGDVAATALDPLEVTVGTDAEVVVPYEALAAPVAVAVEPLESVGLAASAREEPFEAVVSVAEQRLLPFASNPVPKKGKAVGRTARTAAGEGQPVRLSSITNVEGGL